MPIGEIRMFAGNYAPAGWEFCQGQMLDVRQYEELHRRIGKKFGGDGRESFALPDLRDRAPMHYGNGVNIGDKPRIAIDPPDQDRVDARLHVNHIILLRNEHRMGEGEPFIGEIRIFANSYETQGWLPCDGRLMRIFENTALFSLLSDRYSERYDPNVFRLPNLQGRMPVHPRNQDELGKAASARGYNDAAPKKTHLPIGFFIAVDGMYPGRP